MPTPADTSQFRVPTLKDDWAEAELPTAMSASDASKAVLVI
jgi:hypothetical protein